jgi:hypothetical protein
MLETHDTYTPARHSGPHYRLWAWPQAVSQIALPQHPLRQHFQVEWAPDEWACACKCHGREGRLHTLWCSLADLICLRAWQLARICVHRAYNILSDMIGNLPSRPWLYRQKVCGPKIWIKGIGLLRHKKWIEGIGLFIEEFGLLQTASWLDESCQRQCCSAIETAWQNILSRAPWKQAFFTVYSSIYDRQE